MNKEKIRNINVSKSMAKLIGTVVLVDSLIVGIVCLGGHIPIHQDDKKIYQIEEIKTKETNDIKEVSTNTFYQNNYDIRNKVVYYQKPYLLDGKLFRNITTVYNDITGPVKETKRVLVANNIEDEAYIETYEYNKDLDNYIIVKESLYDEVLSDTALLLILGIIDTGMICIGNSYIKRKEEL